MKNIIKQFNVSGNCEIFIDEIIEQWNNRCVIFRWVDEYRLVEEIWLLGKNTGRDKVKISINQSDARLLILKLNLVEEQSFLKSGKTYRTANSEAHHVIIEQAEYIKQANRKIRELHKKFNHS